MSKLLDFYIVDNIIPEIQYSNIKILPDCSELIKLGNRIKDKSLERSKDWKWSL